MLESKLQESVVSMGFGDVCTVTALLGVVFPSPYVPKLQLIGGRPFVVEWQPYVFSLDCVLLCVYYV